MVSRKFLSTFLLILTLFMTVSLCSSASTKANDYSYGKDDVATLYGKVDDASAAKLILQLQKEQNGSDKPIYLFIDSPGGSVFAGLKIIDAMDASSRPIYTVAIGTAASMAAYIHAHGAKRFVLNHAVIMLHNASTSYDGDAVKMESRLVMLKTIMYNLNLDVAKRTGISIEELLAKENAEWWILSGEAVDRHFVDAVVSTLDFPVLVPSEEKSD